MSFTFLLMLLSLVIIIPMIFVIAQHSKKQQLESSHQHQIYLNNHAKSTLYNTHPELKNAANIDSYANDSKLPASFCQTLFLIKDNYLQLTSASLTEEQRFTVDKLVGVRLPEILEDYLALDDQYAATVIIDSHKELTSQDVAYSQLVSMNDFLRHMLNTGQMQLSNNLLISRHYLKSVYGEFYESDADFDAVKAPTTDEIADISIPKNDLFLQLGEAYLEDCDSILNQSSGSLHCINPTDTVLLGQYKNSIGESIVLQLGNLVYHAESVLDYMDTLFLDPDSLPCFDQLISQSIPQLLRQSIQGQLVSQSIPDNDSNLVQLSQAQMLSITQKVSAVNDLLEACLDALSAFDTEESKNNIEQLEHFLNRKNAEAADLIQQEF